MPELRILLFGQPRLEADGVPRKIKRRKVTALLAYLAMERRPHSRDELAELLYPHMDRNRAYAGLRQTLSYLKAETGDGVLEASAGSIAPLGGPGLFLDVSEFRSLISRAGGAREPEDLAAAVKLYRGPFLQGFFLRDSPPFEEWQSGLAEELGSEYASALIRLHDLHLERGSLDQALECARSIVALDRLDETAQRRLIRTLAAAGRKRDAIRQYETFRTLLSQEMNAEPEHETQVLVAGIRSASASRPADLRAAQRKEIRDPLKTRRFRLAWSLTAAVLACLLGAWGYYAHHQGYWPFAAAVREPHPREIAVGVLPFDNLSDNPEESYFCDGLTEDLTTALASIPRLKTAARSTMFTFKGKSPDVRQLGRELGLSYMLEGSVRKAGNSIRINAQLIDTGNGSTVWAKKFDRKLASIFEIQDDIVRSIMTELDVQLISGEQARLYRASTKNAEAYDLFLRAVDYTVSPGGFARAVALLDQALVLDPTFTAALCYKGIFLILQARLGFVEDPARALKEARLAFEKALELDDRSADAHAGRGMILFLERKFEDAEKEYELALSFGPTMESTNSVCAAFYNWKKDYPKALLLVRRAKELSRLPGSQTYAWEIVILRNMGRLEEAYAVARRALELWPDGLDILVNYGNVCRADETSGRARLGDQEDCGDSARLQRQALGGSHRADHRGSSGPVHR